MRHVVQFWVGWYPTPLTRVTLHSHRLICTPRQTENAHRNVFSWKFSHSLHFLPLLQSWEAKQATSEYSVKYYFISERKQDSSIQAHIYIHFFTNVMPFHVFIYIYILFLDTDTRTYVCRYVCMYISLCIYIAIVIDR